MRSTFPILILVMLLLALIGLTACGSSQKTPQDDLKKKSNSENGIEFVYSIQRGKVLIDNGPGNFVVDRDTLRFHICKNAVFCDYKYQINVDSNNLKIIENCDPMKMQKRSMSFCVFCRITGLKKGVYYLNYGSGIKNIIIK